MRHIARLRREHLTESLPAEHLATITSLSAGLLRQVIPEEHEEALTEGGYIKRVLGGHVLTESGQLRVAIGE